MTLAASNIINLVNIVSFLQNVLFCVIYLSKWVVKGFVPHDSTNDQINVI